MRLTVRETLIIGKKYIKRYDQGQTVSSNQSFT